MKFTVYRDKKGEYRWHLHARNGKIIAESGEGYKREAAALRGVHLVCDLYKSGYRIVYEG